ncbi:MAG: hypothetical protein V2J65_19115 [Desulfobacteraceae bacterium]|jgi:hypothetical protein|nr:hypothetical protein [Desulfobacteraceae bacterium]
MALIQGHILIGKFRQCLHQVFPNLPGLIPALFGGGGTYAGKLSLSGLETGQLIQDKGSIDARVAVIVDRTL